MTQTTPEQERTAIFEDIWHLLDAIMLQNEAIHGDGSTWFDENTTAHEALLDIVAKYDPALAKQMARRLEI